MERKTLKGFVVVGILMAAILLPVVSFGFTAPHGYHLAGAPAGDTWSVTDPNEGSINGNWDINRVSWDADTTGTTRYYYFKMQIDSAYSGWTQGTQKDSNFYEILINSKAGVGGTIGSLTGVDYILYLYDTDKSSTTAVGARSWTGAAFGSWSPTGLDYQLTNSNKTLEWRILRTSVTNDFLPWEFAGVTRIGGGTSDSAWLNYTDITEKALTPIPSAAWLLGSGVIGLIGLKRRKRMSA